MKVLALDASGGAASAAVVDEKTVIAEFFVHCSKKHSETLMPLVAAALEASETSIEDVDYIACPSGPGSFTGLRIVAATAKGLAAGANKRIIPVPALAALAYNIASDGVFIAPIMDARREQVYAALFKRQDGVFSRVLGDCALSVDDFLLKIAGYAERAVFIGDGSELFGEKLKTAGHLTAPPGFNALRAASVGALAVLTSGKSAVDGRCFAPEYMRLPQAEREYRERT
jgi:tRNA threonylcarbamoyladenosine biosynthesis protein TsaB